MITCGQPRRLSSQTKTLPINPAPPVTNTRLFLQFSFSMVISLFKVATARQSAQSDLPLTRESPARSRASGLSQTNSGPVLSNLLEINRISHSPFLQVGLILNI